MKYIITVFQEDNLDNLTFTIKCFNFLAIKIRLLVLSGEKK